MTWLRMICEVTLNRLTRSKPCSLHHAPFQQTPCFHVLRRRSAAEVDHPPRVTKRAFPDGPGNNRGRMFSCAICLDEHSMEDCYTASTCGHRMCRNAARKVVLGAVRFAPAIDNSLSKTRCLVVQRSFWDH